MKEKRKETSFKKGRKRKGGVESLQDSFSGLAARIMEIYVLGMLCVFPFYMHDRYFDILESRFGFFWKFTLLVAVLMLLLGLVYLISDRMLADGMGMSLYHFRLLPADIPFTVFILLQFLSMALSGYPYESWWGNLGRFLGVLFWLMAWASYVMVSRFYRFKAWHLWLFLAAGAFICYWGITDFFLKDIFSMFEGLQWTHKTQFTSSIGNINSYTSVVVMVLALSLYLFLDEEKLPLAIFYFFVQGIAALAGVMGRSDSAFLSYVLIYGGLPVFAVRDHRSLSRYLLALFVMLASARAASLIAASSIVTVSINSITSILMRIGAQPLLTPLCIALFGEVLLSFAWPCFSVKDKGERRAFWTRPFDPAKLRWFRGIYLSVAGILFLLVFMVLLDANVGNHAELWEPFRGILVIDDNWGTGRGFIWKAAMRFYFENMSFVQKLFGFGPEGFYRISMDNFFNEMVGLGMGMFDEAHNEYLNYLMTLGLLGLLSYLCLMRAFLYSLMGKSGKEGRLFHKMINAMAEKDGPLRPLGTFCKKVEALSSEGAADAAMGKEGEGQFSGNARFRHAGALVLGAYLVQALLNVAVCIVVPLMLLLVYVALAVPEGERAAAQ